MKNSLRKNLIAILTALFAVMLAFSALTASFSAKADVTPVELADAVITMHDGASIKTSGNMGIKFKATLSVSDYEGLKAKYGDTLSYGMIIAPADFVDSDTDMNVNGWTVTENDVEVEVKKYEGVKESGVKYFQMATVQPVLNTETNLYEFFGAFVGVQTENYARDFVVRAFATASGEQPNYSAQTSRNVYTVATYAMESGAIADNETAETYFKEITGSVNASYAKGYNVTVENLTDAGAKFEVGDKISVTATVVDANGNTVEAKPTLSSISGKLTKNIDEKTGLGDGTYTVAKAGDFYVNAEVSGTVAGADKSKSRSIWFDGVNTTGTVTEYNDPTSDFFTLGANTTLTVGELPLDTETNLYKAISTNPTDKDVLVFNSPNGGTGSANTMYIGKNYKDSIVGKYLSFKYYSTHSGYNSGGWAFSDGQTHNSVVDNTQSSTYYGRWILNQYNSDYQLLTGSGNLTPAKCAGSWLTVEVKVMEWSTTSDIFGRFHINGENENKYIYLTDFKVSDHSIYSEGYSDLEITVEGATGANGVANPEDVLTIKAYAMPLGGTEKVQVPATLTYTDGALAENSDGTYTYSGTTGDFEVNARFWCGLTANVEVKANVKPVVTEITPTHNGNMTITLVEDTDSLAIPVSGVEKVYNATATTAGFSHNITLAKENQYSGMYITFKYYFTGIYMSLSDLDLETNKVDQLQGTSAAGQFKATQYDANGNEIVPTNLVAGNSTLAKYKNQWITVEIQVVAIGSRTLRIHFDSVGTVYFADFKVANYSMTEKYSDLQVVLSGASGENGQFISGDEVVVSVSANEFGVSGRVNVPNSVLGLTFSENAVELVDGKYIYQGNGDFTLTAKYFGESATANASGKIAVKKTALTPESYKLAEMTLMTDMTGTDVNNADGKTIYKMVRDAGGQGFYLAKQANNAEISGKIVTFKYYFNGKTLAFNEDCNLEVGSYSKNNPTRLGVYSLNSYDENGNLITENIYNNSSKYINTWITVEAEITTIGSYGIYIHFDSNCTYYFADFYVTNVSLINTAE